MSLKTYRPQSSLDACVIENPVDLFYLTGLTLSKGYLVIKHGEAKLFVDGRYFAAASQKAPCSVERLEGKGLSKYLEGTSGFDSSYVTYESYEKLKENFPHVKWIPVANPLKEARVCKNDFEIEALKKAARVTAEGYRHIRSLLTEGVSEEELALEYEFFCRKNGASGLSFEPIIAFGKNSAYPHHRAGKDRLQSNQIVLIDVGAVVDGYRGDMTRMVCFGDVDPEVRRLLDLVKQAQKKAVEAVRPGLAIGTLDQMVRRFFKEHGVEELFTHSLGHGIGLETHEYPRVKWDHPDAALQLRPGMVFTIEPGLYLAGLGGARYEDMILVTEQGSMNLFQNVQ